MPENRLYSDDDIVKMIEDSPGKKMSQIDMEAIFGVKLRCNTKWRCRLYRINKRRIEQNLPPIRLFGRNSDAAFYYFKYTL